MKPTHRSADGTDFHTTDPELQKVLDRVRRDRIRVRLTYDGAYGNMGEDHDFGYIGRTAGNPNYPNGGLKSPLLVHNSRSTGGGILMDDHIIKIETSPSKGRRVLWQRGNDTHVRAIS